MTRQDSPVLIPHSPLYTDLYQFTMAQGYFFTRRHLQPAVFDLHFRNNPFEGGFVIASGIEEAADYFSDFRFHPGDLEYLRAQGFKKEFLSYLKGMRLRLDVEAVREGEVVFPHEPLMRVHGPLLESQLAETVLINLVHFSSLVATKASRIVRAARGRTVIDFGLRRAQGPAGFQASRAAYVGGVHATSNVLAAKTYGLPVSGTQAHSWIQAVGDEKQSFLDFGRLYRDQAVVLIDTYNTLKSGLPHLLEALEVLRREGIEIKGVRIDSGDLAYLSKRVRAQLDNAGFPKVQIFASGQLDEYIIESLLNQDAKIDGFGVGTKLATSYDEPALDMVYKLARIRDKPEIKISDSLTKMNEPGLKQVRRFYSEEGSFLLDAILLEGEKEVPQILHPFYQLANTPVRGLRHERLLQPLIRKGKRVRPKPAAAEARRYAQERLALLPEEHKRFYYPHIYRVGVSQKLFQLKERLIAGRLGVREKKAISRKERNL
ncbi:MAG TPA: nicotinate phosphoribosyltransferase [Verrucomicrobiae bacterium]|nr:nicotinate phosphoribosyltransferase [Verrucomicrobiae bacterium]